MQELPSPHIQFSLLVITLSLPLYSTPLRTTMPIISISRFTPIFIFLTCSLLLFQSTPIFCINITSLLSPYPDLSNFNNLLTTSGIAQDLIQRSSVTLLAVPNKYIHSATTADLPRQANIADVLRYHVLLQYLTWSELRKISATGELVTTLFQTTGRANGNLGAVNVTSNPTDDTVYIRSPVPYSPSNITVLSLIRTLPYNVSIFSVNSFLIPYGFDLMASENRPPIGLSLTKILIDGHNFNVAASMLTASGLTKKFEEDEAGAGITMFVPTDEAFAKLPTSEQFKSLPADRKTTILEFHVLHSYYPLGSLESIVNPLQPTLATEDMGAGRFTLNISRLNGSVAIDSGIVLASITQTIFDQNPVAIFAVSKVLLPREIFGKEEAIRGSGIIGGAPPPEVPLAPEYSPELGVPPSGLPYSPGGSREELKSNARSINGGYLFCIALLYVLV